MFSKEVIYETVLSQIQYIINLKAKEFGRDPDKIRLRVDKYNGELRLNVIVVHDDKMILETMNREQVCKLFKIPLYLKMLKVEERVVNTLMNLLESRLSFLLFFPDGKAIATHNQRVKELTTEDFENAFKK